MFGSQSSIDDIGRFGATARAFSLALDRLCTARGPFVAGAADLHAALGEDHAAARYHETFVGMLKVESDTWRTASPWWMTPRAI